MDVPHVLAFAILMLARLASTAPVEVPVVEEFHKAMTNWDSDNIIDILNTEARNVVEELNVTSDTVLGYPDDSRGLFAEIKNGQHNGTNLAAVMGGKLVPWAIFVFLILLATMVTVSAACCVVGRKILRGCTKRKSEKDVLNLRPSSIVVTDEDNEQVDSTHSTPPNQANDSSDDSVYSINVSRKTEVIPPSYIV